MCEGTSNCAESIFRRPTPSNIWHQLIYVQNIFFPSMTVIIDMYYYTCYNLQNIVRYKKKASMKITKVWRVNIECRQNNVSHSWDC